MTDQKWEQVLKAREYFEELLKLRNRHGLMSEDTDPATGELKIKFAIHC